MSPFILLFIKLQAVVKPHSKLIMHQAKMCSRGETLMEATPQLCLQYYVTLLNLDFGWRQIFSMLTSALKICFEHGQKFLEINNIIGTSKLVKYFPIILFNSIFRVSTMALIFIFFQESSIFIVLCYCFLLFCMFYILLGCYDLRKEKSDRYEMLECIMAFWLSITNLAPSRVARFILLVSTYYNLLVNSTILLTILTICNLDPDTAINPNNSVHWGEQTYGTAWGRLLLVENIFYLNLIVGLRSEMFIDIFSLKYIFPSKIFCPLKIFFPSKIFFFHLKYFLPLNYMF